MQIHSFREPRIVQELRLNIRVRADHIHFQVFNGCHLSAKNEITVKLFINSTPASVFFCFFLFNFILLLK